MAIGAVDAMDSARQDRQWNPEGELDFIDDVVKHALMLDRLADIVVDTGGFSGVFVYEVAQEFGYKLALRTINGLDLRVEELAAQLIKDAT